MWAWRAPAVLGTRGPEPPQVEPGLLRRQTLPCTAGVVRSASLSFPLSRGDVAETLSSALANLFQNAAPEWSGSLGSHTFCVGQMYLVLHDLNFF